MKPTNIVLQFVFSGLLVFGLFSQQAYTQRINHSASRVAAGNRSAPVATQRPANVSNRSVNGGSVKASNRMGNTNTNINNNNRNTNINANNRNTNISGNNVNSGNNININIDNSRNYNPNYNRYTVAAPLPASYYPRPPYVWGGQHFYCFHPYHYHVFVPYVWAPTWHPWGFFLTTLTVTAIIVSVENEKYHYDQGVWYAQSKEGYTAVPAPVGGTVNNIPEGAQTVVVNNTTNYYYGGTYYEKSGKEYKVVAPPAGAVVDHLPEGGQEVKIGDQTYVKVGETYYQPVEGNKYEVVQVEKEKK